MTSRCTCAFSYQPWTGFVIPVLSLCWSNRQMMPEVAFFCHHTRPRRGQEMCGMNHASARVAHSSLAPRCTTLFPCSPGANDISGEGGLVPREERKVQVPHGKVHYSGRIVGPEENSLAVDAKHICTRMVFRNSNRTLLCLRTRVKGLFVPSPNPRAYWS